MSNKKPRPPPRPNNKRKASTPARGDIRNFLRPRCPSRAFSSHSSTSPASPAYASPPPLPPRTSSSHNLLPTHCLIPLLSIISHNVTSLAEYGGGKGPSALFPLYQRYSIFGLQETKLGAMATNSYIERRSPDHKIFYGNNPDNTNIDTRSFKAGVLLGVRLSLWTSHHIVCPEVPTTLRGHAIAVVARNKTDHDSGFLVCNVRLAASDPRQQELQIASLLKWLEDIREGGDLVPYVFGDFNFTTMQSDSSYDLNPAPRPNFDLLLTALRLQDVYQPLHTYHFLSSSSSRVPCSSRLDRFYCGLSEADLAIAAPHTYIPANLLEGRGSFSGHLPVALSFANKPQRPGFRLPDSTVNNPRFRNTFLKLWSNLPASPAGHQTLLSFKNTLKRTHYLLRDSNPRSIIGRFMAGTRLYTVLSRDTVVATEYQAILKTYPSLAKLVRKISGRWVLNDLRAWLNTNYAHSGVPATTEPTVLSVKDIPALPPTNPSASPLTSIKITLPSTRSSVRALRSNLSDPPVSSPELLGHIISDHYGSLWSVSDTDEDFRENYLADYDKNIDTSLLTEPNLELVNRAIVLAPASSRGPDGIPFSAYKVLKDVAAPILLDCARDLCQNLPPSGFNYSRLVLLEKRATHLVNDTRPICVNNTDNRIIAKVFVFGTCDAAQELIGNYQKMFLPGRQMIDHLRGLNEEFFGSLHDQQRLYALFTDNKKAFDSIHHGYIHDTLSRMNFPSWFKNAVRGLLAGAVAHPDLAPNFAIPLLRGVKQGCPLSPLLFLLCYDPLLTKLARKTDVTARAAADDLSITSPRIESLISCFPLVDAFTRASGMGINEDKTKIVCTYPPPFLAHLTLTTRSLAARACAHAAHAASAKAIAAAAFSSISRHLSSSPNPPALPSLTFTPSSCFSSLSPPASPSPSPSRSSSSSPPFSSSSSSSSSSPPSSFSSLPSSSPPLRNPPTAPKRRRNSSKFTHRKKRNPAPPPLPLPFDFTLTAPPPPKTCPHVLLLKSSWPGVKITNSYTYLGFPIGPHITSKDVFKNAMEKIADRIALFRKAMRGMSVQRRIITMNVFILPILSYLNQFVNLPQLGDCNYYKALRSLIHKACTPYGGKAWGYNALIIPASSGGFPTPLRDPWIENILALLRNVDWPTSSASTWAISSFSDQLSDASSGIYPLSPRISDNVNLAIADFLSPRYYNWDGHSDIPHFSKKQIKSYLISSVIKYDADLAKEYTLDYGKDWHSFIDDRLGHLGVQDYKDDLFSHHSKPIKIPSLFENHFKILTNALPTATRRRHITNLSPNAATPCPFCQCANDGIKHIFFNCPTIKAALPATLSAVKAPPDVSSQLLSYNYPLFIPTKKSIGFDSLLLCYTLCRAITLAMRRRADGIAVDLLHFLPSNTSRLFYSATTPKNTSFGSANRRSATQAAAALAYAQGIINMLPNSTVVCYTDGSAVPNPGPSGSGVYISPHPLTGHAGIHLGSSIGHGTNNLGELCAIDIAIRYLLDNAPPCEVAILTDSSLAIRTLDNGFSADSTLNPTVQDILHLIRSNTDYTFKPIWVPGHVDLHGNDIADTLANYFAQNNGDHSPPSSANFFTFTLVDSSHHLALTNNIINSSLSL